MANSNLINTIRWNSFCYYRSGYPIKDTFFRDNSPLGTFLNIEVPESGQFFIPNIEISKTLSLLSLGESHIAYPLYYKNQISKRTASAIIKALWECSRVSRLIKCKTAKEIYYGGPGMIFNSQLKPLLMCGYIMNKNSEGISLVKPICYVDCTVFSNKDLLSKAIIKDIIPCISTQNMYISSAFSELINNIPQDWFDGPNYLNKVEVIIKDLSNMVFKPRTPELEKNELNSSLWECVQNNI